MSNPFISFLVIILSAGFGFFYVKPSYDTVQQRRIDVAKLDVTLKDTSAIQTLIDQTEKTLGNIDQTELSRFMIFLPQTTDAIGLANNIQHIALGRGIVISDIKVVESKPKTGSDQQSGIGDVAAGVKAAVSAPTYGTTKTTFTLISNTEAFRLFLGDLEKSLGLMNVTSLSFAPASDSKENQKVKRVGAPVYQYSLEVETYSLK